eukprot:TRINITY_DN6096_c0_g1_i1.p1 TRINITY_DN6096_c0_g1~~TRINITY_DN6096_c0_g1_i1.p1  ORF type:complete len:285 (-),score=7.68 TRINITY_DN6096_c0_g1_i1:74-928(-)
MRPAVVVVLVCVFLACLIWAQVRQALANPYTRPSKTPSVKTRDERFSPAAVYSRAANQHVCCQAKSLRLAAVGDSITRTYAPFIQRALQQQATCQANITAVGFGVFGVNLLPEEFITCPRPSKWQLYKERLKRKQLPSCKQSIWGTATLQRALSWRPNFVVIMLGTNDSKQKRLHALSEPLRDSLRRLLHLFRQAGNASSCFEAWVLVPPHVYSDVFQHSDNHLHAVIAPLLRGTGVENGAHILDMAPLIPRDMTTDGIHPNRDGSLRIAEAVANAVAKLLQAT